MVRRRRLTRNRVGAAADEDGYECTSAIDVATVADGATDGGREIKQECTGSTAATVEENDGKEQTSAGYAAYQGRLDIFIKSKKETQMAIIEKAFQRRRSVRCLNCDGVYKSAKRCFNHLQVCSDKKPAISDNHRPKRMKNVDASTDNNNESWLAKFNAYRDRNTDWLALDISQQRRIAQRAWEENDGELGCLKVDCGNTTTYKSCSGFLYHLGRCLDPEVTAKKYTSDSNKMFSEDEIASGEPLKVWHSFKGRYDELMEQYPVERLMILIQYLYRTLKRSGGSARAPVECPNCAKKMCSVTAMKYHITRCQEMQLATKRKHITQTSREDLEADVPLKVWNEFAGRPTELLSCFPEEHMVMLIEAVFRCKSAPPDIVCPAKDCGKSFSNKHDTRRDIVRHITSLCGTQGETVETWRCGHCSEKMSDTNRDCHLRICRKYLKKKAGCSSPIDDLLEAAEIDEQRRTRSTLKRSNANRTNDDDFVNDTSLSMLSEGAEENESNDMDYEYGIDVDGASVSSLKKQRLNGKKESARRKGVSVFTVNSDGVASPAPEVLTSKQHKDELTNYQTHIYRTIVKDSWRKYVATNSTATFVPNWVCKTEDWQVVQNIAASRLPNTRQSLRIKLRSDEQPRRIDPFSSETIDNCGMALYCGGPISTLSCCVESGSTLTYYLAVSVFPDVEMCKTDATHDVIQIWGVELGTVNVDGSTKPMVSSAKLQFCILTNTGTMLDAKWMPLSGNDEQQFGHRRIGVLAVATLQAHIDVYAVADVRSVPAVGEDVYYDPPPCLSVSVGECPLTRIEWCPFAAAAFPQLLVLGADGQVTLISISSCGSDYTRDILVTVPTTEPLKAVKGIGWLAPSKVLLSLYDRSMKVVETTTGDCLVDAGEKNKVSGSRVACAPNFLSSVTFNNLALNYKHRVHACLMRNDFGQYQWLELPNFHADMITEVVICPTTGDIVSACEDGSVLVGRCNKFLPRSDTARPNATNPYTSLNMLLKVNVVSSKSDEKPTSESFLQYEDYDRDYHLQLGFQSSELPSLRQKSELDEQTSLPIKSLYRVSANCPMANTNDARSVVTAVGGQAGFVFLLLNDNAMQVSDDR